MEHGSDCNHSNCTHTNASVCQTISEMDWERGLWYAAYCGDEERVKSLINKAKTPKDLVNTPDNAGYTPLHYAARKGHTQICKILLQHGAQINIQTKSGRATPLHKAAVAGKIETVKLLIHSGAQVETQDADGQTVLHKTAEHNHIELFNYLVESCPGLTSIKDMKGYNPCDYNMSKSI